MRAHALEALGRPEEALAIYQQVLATRPEHAEALHNVANVLCQLGRVGRGDRCLRTRARLAPRGRRGAFQLELRPPPGGDYEPGWKEYEWRWEALRTKLPSAAAGKPLWLGEPDIAGRTVVVYAEQGFGDAIQMARLRAFARRARRRSGDRLRPAARAAALERGGRAHRVQLERNARGVRLSHTIMSCRELSAHARQHSVPGALSARRTAAVEAWRARLAALGAQRKIGLVWAGNPSPARPHAFAADRAARAAAPRSELHFPQPAEG